MLPLYSLTILTSAFLLFLVQPMVARMILPYLGGAPAVWNTAMLFYQAMLLAGYAYAHFSTRWLGVRRQAILHMALLALSLLSLPLALHTELGFAPAENPPLWLLLALTASVGLPFFVLSANAPLVQLWFAHTGHRDAANPYFLYSASNLGSFAALLAYPFLLEPLLPVSAQSMLWSLLYGMFLLLLGSSAWLLRQRHFKPETVREMSTKSDTPSLMRKLRWVFLALVPSSLMLGLTSFITTDVAAVPLFWIVPLAIYLLTYVLAFSRTIDLYERSLNAQILLITAVVVFLLVPPLTMLLMPMIVLHLAAFFATAMVCHSQLARTRPAPAHLTEFYLWIALGGMLGGLFNAILAPVLFTEIEEYPLMIVLACLLWPSPKDAAYPAQERLLDFIYPLLLGGVFALYILIGRAAATTYGVEMEAANRWLDEMFTNRITLEHFGYLAILATLCGAVYLFHRRPLRFVLGIAVLLWVVPLLEKTTPPLHTERNFFGVVKVVHNPENNSHVLLHGTTNHGVQVQSGEDRLKPVSYYAKLKEIFDVVPLRRDPVGVLGLGAGTVACYGLPAQRFDFYEINPAVIRIARDPALFTYLRDCPPESAVILGDARLSLENVEDAAYGLIIVDIYSSDALPMHIFTREALALYLRKLKPDGVLAFHISSRHLDLAPVLGRLAYDADLSSLFGKGKGENALILASHWMVMARDAAILMPLIGEASGWKSVKQDDGRVWTDDYSNILEPLLARLLQR